MATAAKSKAKAKTETKSKPTNGKPAAKQATPPKSLDDVLAEREQQRQQQRLDLLRRSDELVHASATGKPTDPNVIADVLEALERPKELFDEDTARLEKRIVQSALAGRLEEFKAEIPKLREERVSIEAEIKELQSQLDDLDRKEAVNQSQINKATDAQRALPKSASIELQRQHQQTITALRKANEDLKHAIGSVSMHQRVLDSTIADLAKLQEGSDRKDYLEQRATSQRATVERVTGERDAIESQIAMLVIRRDDLALEMLEPKNFQRAEG